MKKFKKEEQVFFIQSTYWALNSLVVHKWIIEKNNWIRSWTYEIAYTYNWIEYLHEVNNSNIFTNESDAIEFLRWILDERLTRSHNNIKRANEDVIRYTEESKEISSIINSLTLK